MSAEKHPDWLIDCLYEDDLVDDDMSLESRDNLTPEQEAQLLEMQQFLGELREHIPHMPLAEPRASLRTNLLAAAQQEITVQSEQEASATRKPQTPRGSGESLWTRSRFHAIAQISAVATVLIVGVFSLAQFQKNMSPEADMAAAPEMAKTTTSPNAPAALAKADTKAKNSDPIPGAPVLEDFPEKKPAPVQNTAPKKDLALAMNGKDKKEDESKTLNNDDIQENKPVTKKPKPTKRAYASKSAKKRPATPDDLMNFGKSNYRSGRSVSNATSEAVKDNVASRRNKQQKNSSFFSSPEAPSRAVKGSTSTKSDANYAKNDIVVDNAPTKEPTSTYKNKKSVASKVAAPRTADAKPASVTSSSHQKTAPAKAKAASTPTISSIERSYRAEKFDNTLTEANQFLKTGRGTAKQRARAMELKAKAYQRLGQSDQASRIYTEIRKKYPTYYKKKAVKYPAKRSRKKSKSKIDYMESF